MSNTGCWLLPVLIAYNADCFEKGSCQPFKADKKMATYFLQCRCYKIGFEG